MTSLSLKVKRATLGSTPGDMKNGSNIAIMKMIVTIATIWSVVTHYHQFGERYQGISFL